jgi:hypothetical protein
MVKSIQHFQYKETCQWHTNILADPSQYYGPTTPPPKQKKLFLPLVLDQQVFGISMYRESSIEINGPWQPLLN